MKGTKTWMKEAEVKKNVGEIFVTQKADLGVDFVVSPDETVSIEITGDKLSFTGDRIMVIWAANKRFEIQSSSSKFRELELANFTGLVLGCIEAKFCK